MDARNVNFITALFILVQPNGMSCQFHMINKSIFFFKKKHKKPKKNFSLALTTLVCPSASASAGFCPFISPHPQSVSPWLPDLDLSCVSILITRNLETHLQSRAWLWGAALRTSLFYTSLSPQEAGMGFSGPLLGRKNGRVLARRINVGGTKNATPSPSP